MNVVQFQILLRDLPEKVQINLLSIFIFIDSTVTNTIWSASGASDSSIYSKVIDVYPNTEYTLQIHALRSGLASSNAKISKIVIDGINVGHECNPDGKDTDCDFYNCGSAIGNTRFGSTSGKLSVELEYEKNSAECYCDTTNWRCSSGMGSFFKTHIEAAAQIILTPWGNLVLQLEFDR